MAYSQKCIQRLSVLASVLGIIQGAVWFLGSLFSILLYYNLVTMDIDAGSLMDIIFKILASETDRTIIFFMFVYAVLSITLCIFSAFIINGIVAKSETSIHYVYVSWSTNVIVLSIIDIVLTCFLGRDMYELPADPPENVINAYSIVLLVACRGVLIWIMNIIFAGYIIVFAAQISHLPPQQRNVIRAFEDSSGPWHTNLGNNPLAKTSRKENVVHGESSISRSYKSLVADDEYSINSEIFEKHQNYEERLANIGKPGKRSPLKSPSPVNVPPPFPPPLIKKTSRKDDESISEIFAGIENSPSPEKNSLDLDAPYIPPPDYSPLGSPNPAMKKPESEKKLHSTFF